MLMKIYQNRHAFALMYIGTVGVLTGFLAVDIWLFLTNYFDQSLIYEAVNFKYSPYKPLYAFVLFHYSQFAVIFGIILIKYNARLYDGELQI